MRDFVAERIAIATCSEIVRSLGGEDVTTRRLIEDIPAKEQERADDLSSLLARMK